MGRGGTRRWKERERVVASEKGGERRLGEGEGEGKRERESNR